MKKLKILLSAYACEPNKGSEPGVGWNWAIQLAEMGHDVWVITRANNQMNIENEKKTLNSLPNLNFIYYDLPAYLRFWKRGQFGVHLYYFLWQIKIAHIAKEYDIKIDFDLVHHITFVSMHQPSFLYRLNKKYVYGPVSGGEEIPNSLLHQFSIKYLIQEYVRSIVNILKPLDFFQRQNLNKANLIFTTSKSTKKLIPSRNQYKTKTKLAIGISNVDRKVKYSVRSTFNIIYVGRFLHWKGIHLAINSFNRINIDSANFTLIGRGPFRNRAETIQEKLKIDNLNFNSWLGQNKLFDKMKKSDCLLFPSMRDSGGMVVLEALSFGLPVICLDLGGPGQIVTNSCGRVIDTENKSEEKVIADLAQALNEIKDNPELREKLSKGAIKRAKDFKWSKVVRDTYDIIENELF